MCFKNQELKLELLWDLKTTFDDGLISEKDYLVLKKLQETCIHDCDLKYNPIIDSAWSCTRCLKIFKIKE